MRRARLLILASAVAMLGWGAVLPYQYAYAAQSRGWGGMAGAAAASLFSVGALVAAPLGGRLADRHHPALVAAVARLLAAAAAAGLILADQPVTFLLGMATFGFGLAGGAPAQSVLALRWTAGAGDRRRVFAWIASGQALGMGVGSFAAGFLVDLHRPDGLAPGFVIAAAGFALSALLIAVAARGVNDLTEPPITVGELDARPARAVRLIMASPALLLTAVITIALALAYNAQFESGLPAYGLTRLGISEQTVGIAAAVNCAVILALQMLVIRWTGRRSAAVLLTVVGAVWVLCWALLGATGMLPGPASAVFIGVFGLFAVGETLYAPVLNPLVAGLAPSHLVGVTLGLFTALQTGATAVGPLLSGATLGAGLGPVFIGGNIVISLVAVAAGWRLRSVLRVRRPQAVPARVAVR